MNGFRAFLKRKNIEFSAKRYGVDALGAMAQGLFCTLLVGTILNTLGTQFHIGFLSATVVTVGTGETATAYTIGGLASAMVGPAMAVAIGSALQAPPLVLFSLVPVGFATNILGGAGGPLAVLVIAIIAAECGKAVSKETKIDILVTPIVTVLAGIGVAYLVAPPIGKAASWVGNLIMWATELQPFFMGILVSVIVGIALTLPISSAAICAALGLTGLAGGAAVAGCCAQMVGFAVLSFRENKWGGLVSQGLGTSMLQMGNIVRNPKIWIPATLASAITGPIATCIFRLEMNGAAVSSGMGTCGLVGPIGVYTGWVDQITQGTKAGITEHTLQKSCRCIVAQATYLARTAHVHTQYWVGLLKAVEAELAGLDTHIVEVEEVLVWLLYWQTEHHAGSQLDEVDLQHLTNEWERTAGTKVTLDNENIIVASHKLNVERSVDMKFLGNLTAYSLHTANSLHIQLLRRELDGSIA